MNLLKKLLGRKYTEFITVKELAIRMTEKSGDLIKVVDENGNDGNN